ncbi:NRDE family protein [Sporosarcina beigongshangi]|uniref:NRDE family protein n=1 Tax=Sporosarcina beigongshangi TaxID=2782538 RepID=UPI00193A60B8|nr:NRDE family protein [Sporosarcina beigongshangi]
MCLINIHYGGHSNYKLIIAANRDESYDRPTAQASFWVDNPNLLAGRDLVHNGTWLGVTKSGRFAALTNYRDPAEFGVEKKSRGDIVKDFLMENSSPVEFLKTLQNHSNEYAGFNLIVGNLDGLFYFSNKKEGIKEIPMGTHSLSNEFLNTPWPKVVKGKERLRNYVQQHEVIETDALFDILHDTEIASDELLPDTGVGMDLERMLSPLFIKTPNYGTRCSTVVLVGYDNSITFVERSFSKGVEVDEVRFDF